MRVLITGAHGFVGKNLIPQLSTSNELEVVATDIIPSESGPNASFNLLDVTDEFAVLSSLRDIDVVVHLATHQLVPSLSDPRLNAKVNILGMLNILEAARKTNVKRVVFSSASSIVGDVLYNPVDEKHPCNPKTPYGVTKLACEHYLKVYQRLFGLDYLIFRFFNIYGPHQIRGLIPSVYQKITEMKEFDIYGNGKQMRDYVYVGDLGGLFLRGILKDVKNMTLNVGTGLGLNVLDIVDLAGRILGKRPKLRFNPPRPGEIGNFVASTDAIKTALGIVPSTPVEEGLKRTFDWLARGR
jgi:UDP-glucose 4-epimerase